MTIYNPFSGGNESLDRVGHLALEGEDATPFPTGLNDVIRDVGSRYGATLVDIYPLFEGKAAEYIAFDLIHPNDTGYAAMAEAVVEAMVAGGLQVAVIQEEG